MKNALFLVAGFAGFIAVGAALAGAPPASCECCPQPVQTRCHGRPAMQAVQGGCHGMNFVAPAAVQGGCHGGRLTWNERRTARSMARQNYNATLAAARSAGRAGDGIQSVSYEAPAMTMVPVKAAVCKCDCSPCKCK